MLALLLCHFYYCFIILFRAPLPFDLPRSEEPIANPFDDQLWLLVVKSTKHDCSSVCFRMDQRGRKSAFLLFAMFLFCSTWRWCILKMLFLVVLMISITDFWHLRWYNDPCKIIFNVPHFITEQVRPLVARVKESVPVVLTSAVFYYTALRSYI